jgi:hypothetical protein
MHQGLTDLLNYGFTLARFLLKEQQGECYPLAVYLDKDGKPAQHLAYFGDELPLSTELIKQLETDLLSIFRDNNSFTYAIIYDAFVKGNSTEKKTNTMVAKFCSSYDNTNGHYFLPYKIENNNVVFQTGWIE